jgi:hypothetical protein
MERADIGEQLAQPLQPTPLIVAAEKNLEEIGFFSASSTTGPQPRTKTVHWTRDRDGKQLEIEVTILGRQFGLPNTWDLDLYRAFQHILWARYISKDLPIPDPIPFTSPDLLLHARKEYGGKQGDAVYRWMQKMMLTGIASKGAVFDAGRGTWVTTPTPKARRARKPERDLLYTLTVFRQVTQEGHMVQGIRASRNMAWLQDWYRSNLERSFTKPVDVDLHFSLARPLSKILFAVLDVMLYAGEGHACKRYDDLCAVLGIAQKNHFSKIREQLDPAFEELKAMEYLRSVQYRRSKDDTTWTITWDAGRRWFDSGKRGINKKGTSGLLSPIERGQMALDFRRAAPAAATETRVPCVVTTGAMSENDEASGLVRIFRELKGHKKADRTVGRTERDQARTVIGNHGLEMAQEIVRYAVGEMKKTNFQAVWFGSVLLYVDGAVRHIQDKKEAAAVAQARVGAAESARIQVESNRRQALDDAFSRLTSDELTELKTEAERKLVKNPFVQPALGQDRGDIIRLQMRQDLAQRLGLQ